jgi:hypothetical protein
MTNLDDVYRKFGEVAEAAQLLETELGNMLFLTGAIDAGLLEEPDGKRATDLLAFVNRQTLGYLLRSLNRSIDRLDDLSELFDRALLARNRLSHSFYREHNFRRNTAEGCVLMLEDLESIQETIIRAYKAVMLLSGVDLDKITLDELPARHVPI